MPRECVATWNFDSDYTRNLPAIINVGCVNRLVFPRAVDRRGEQEPAISPRLCQHEVRMGTTEKLRTPTPGKSRDCAERGVRWESSDVAAGQQDEDSSRTDQTKYEADAAIYLAAPPHPRKVEEREDHRQYKFPVHKPRPLDGAPRITDRKRSHPTLQCRRLAILWTLTTGNCELSAVSCQLFGLV